MASRRTSVPGDGRGPGPLVRSWFALTEAERLWVAALAAILLVGMVARHAHRKRERADRYDPAGLPAADGALPGDGPP